MFVFEYFNIVVKFGILDNTFLLSVYVIFKENEIKFAVLYFS